MTLTPMTLTPMTTPLPPPTPRALTSRPGLLAGRRERSRGPDGPPVVLVLSGGSTLGAAQIGHLRALLEAGVVPDVIVGCSVGALNGVAFAADPTLAGLERLEEGWRTVRSADMFPLRSGRTLARLVTGKDHLCSSEPLRETIARFCAAPDLGDLAVPVHVATTDLDSSETRWWTGGPTVDIVAASTAIPAIFPPVSLDGHRHVDGAVLVPVPIERAVDLGAAHIFVSDVSSRERGEKGPLAALIEAFNVARYAGARVPVPEAGQSIAVLPAPPTAGISLTDFGHTARLMSQAHEQARAWLAELAEWNAAADAAGHHSRVDRARLAAWLRVGADIRRGRRAS